jgi:hypothetical protein
MMSDDPDFEYRRSSASARRRDEKSGMKIKRWAA